MNSLKKPTWQQATALVSLSTAGAVTGFAVACGTPADITSPASMPARLMAQDTPAAPASPAAPAAPAAAGDAALRSAIVSVARHYLQLAQARTPAQMEALIWQGDSTDGADHGQSCAAFASLTLALGAAAAGQHSWAAGGASYPWPLHPWADVRVQPDPGSPGIISILQDAQAHHRWHPAGDGYRPQPGDWVIFDGHVEVITRYTGTALYTIGADSLPGLTVNAHKFPAPLAAQGVLGYVDNGHLATAPGPDGQQAGSTAPGTGGGGGGGAQAPGLASPLAGAAAQEGQGPAAIPGTGASALSGGGRARTPPGTGGAPAIPGSQVLTAAGTPPGHAAPSSARPPHPPGYTRHDPPPAPVPGTAAQQAFITMIAPGAIAARHQYGIPAAVTIAQAIDESGWGHSELATADNNLFGIKGTGPAGTDMRPTREYDNGIWVTRTAPFRIYHDITQSITECATPGPDVPVAHAAREPIGLG